MNRFIIQVSFQTEQELEEAKRKLFEIGVEKNDIKHIPSPVVQKSNFQTKIILTYAGLGCLLYYIILFSTSTDSFEATLKATSFIHLTFAIIFVSFFRIPIRYLLSKNKVTKQGYYDRTTIAVATPYEKLNVIKRNLEKFETEHIEVRDDLANVEAGIRV